MWQVRQGKEINVVTIDVTKYERVRIHFKPHSLLKLSYIEHSEQKN